MLFRKIKFFFKDYFTFTKKERRGTFVLILLLLIEAGWLFYLKFLQKQPDPDFSAYEITIHEFVERSKSKEDKPAEVQRKTDSLFTFDPNVVSIYEMQRLGLSDKQARVIAHYRNKGGKFKDAQDFAKMYVVDEVLFQRLKPYLKLPDRPVRKPPYEKKNNDADHSIKSIEINTADSAQFEKLPGIGPVLASRIIRYREALGGFANTSQLQEVYGIDSVNFQRCYLHLKCDTSKLRKLNCNSDSLRHPYLTYKMIRLIKAYRQTHGDYQDPETIRKAALLNEDIYRKIAPYL